MKMTVLDVVASPSKLTLDSLPIPLIGLVILTFLLALFLVYRLCHQTKNTNDTKLFNQSKGQKR